jgi:RNA-directed DNA polymerase
MERVLDPENLDRAWRKVRSNAGAAGIDGMSVGMFPAFAREHWSRIRSMLMEGTYHPAAVGRVFIPKPDGTERPLGIPTVLDRVIQQALGQVLTPLFDGEFSTHSYGFRIGRSAHQAARQLEAGWKAGCRYAVDCDLKSFFDSVPHNRVVGQLRRKVKDPRVLRLIRRYLTSGVVMPDGTREATTSGVPQGGPLSPLLANLVLDPLDKELERRGHRFARYADDFVVMVGSAKAAERVLQSLIRYVEGTLGLVVNRAKSQAVPLKQCAFLGFQIGARGKLVWTAKAHTRFKQRVREITRRNRGHHVKDVIDELRRYVTGWLNYFGISHTYTQVVALAEWVRRRVRLYYWKQWKRPRTRRRHLIRLGIPSDQVKMATRSRKGYWRMAGNSIVQRALTHEWLESQGVPNMRSQWILLHYGPNAPV